MNAEVIADLINKVTNHKTKVSVSQVEDIFRAVETSVELARHITDFIDRCHGWNAFPHLERPEAGEEPQPDQIVNQEEEKE